MSVVLITLIGVLIGGMLLKTTEATLSRGPRAVREKRSEYHCEMFTTRLFEQRLIDAGIQTTLTTCDDSECVVCAPKPLPAPKKKLAKCTTCRVTLDDDGWCSNGCVRMPRPVVKRTPELPKSSGNNCTRCSTPLYSSNTDTCQVCLLSAIQERKEERKAAYRPRMVVLTKDGISYKATVPTEVPDNAHVEIVETFKHGDFFGTWAYWKWTDQKSGRQMGLRSAAYQMDSYEIQTADGKTIRRIIS